MNITLTFRLSMPFSQSNLSSEFALQDRRSSGIPQKAVVFGECSSPLETSTILLKISFPQTPKNE